MNFIDRNTDIVDETGKTFEQKSFVKKIVDWFSGKANEIVVWDYTPLAHRRLTKQQMGKVLNIYDRVKKYT